MAEPVIPKKRFITEKDNIVEFVAWRVPKSGNYLEGVKYSFAFVFNGKRVIAYDNFNNEGHHKHYFGKKMQYKFVSLIETRKAFMKDVEATKFHLFRISSLAAGTTCHWNFVCSKTTHCKWNFERQKPLAVDSA